MCSFASNLPGTSAPQQPSQCIALAPPHGAGCLPSCWRSALPAPCSPLCAADLASVSVLPFWWIVFSPCDWKEKKPRCQVWVLRACVHLNTYPFSCNAFIFSYPSSLKLRWEGRKAEKKSKNGLIWEARALQLAHKQKYNTSIRVWFLRVPFSPYKESEPKPYF